MSSNMTVQMILNLIYNRSGAKDAVADLQAIEKAGASIGKATKETTPQWVEQSRAVEKMRAETQKLTSDMRAFESVGGSVNASWAQGARNFGQISVEARRAAQDVKALGAVMKSAAPSAGGSPFGYTPGDAEHQARIERNRAWARKRVEEDARMRAAAPPVVLPPGPSEGKGGKGGKSGKEDDGFIGGMVKTAAGYMTVEKAIELGKRSVHAAQEGTHSAISLETQGNDPHQIEEVQKHAAQLSDKFRAFSKTSIEHMIGDAITYTGSLEHALEMMPTILKLRTIQQGQTGKSSDADSAAVVKAMEIAGVTNDPAAMHRRAEVFAKLQNYYKETFKPQELKSFYAQAAVGARTLSDEFMMGTGGHLIQEIGGGTLGNDIAMLHRMAAVRAGRTAYNAADELGLLNEDKVVRNKKGEVSKVLPGGVKGDGLIFTDPDKWLLEMVKPGLDKLPEHLREPTLQAMFGNISQLKFADKVLNQHEIIAKDRAGVGRAKGLDAAETWMEKDPALNRTALGSQVENAARNAGKPFAGAFFTKMGTSIIADFNRIADGNEWLAPATGAGVAGGMIVVGTKLAKAGAKSLGRSFAEGAGGGAAEAAVVETAKDVAINFGKGAMLKRMVAGGAVGALALGAADAAEAGIGVVVRAGAEAAGLKGEPGSKLYEERGAEWKAAEERARGGSARTIAGWRRFAETFAQGGDGGVRVPTMADQTAATPQVDTSQVDAAKQKAAEAGAEIRQALDVSVAPKVDVSGIDLAIAKARELKGELAGIGAASAAAGAGLRGAQRSSGALHDGTEVR